MDEKVGKKAFSAPGAVEVEGPREPRLLLPSPASEKGDSNEVRRTRNVVDFRDYAQKETLEAFREIFAKLISLAKQGSYNHLKLLFDVAGVKDQFAKAGRRQKKSKPGLGDLLLEELRKSQEADRAAAKALPESKTI